jgi:hypothetical protein
MRALLYLFRMTRALLLGFLLSTVACGNRSFESLCANQVPPPLACNTACDPTPGAQNACPAGFHCAANGKCDTLCTPKGNECGDGYSCTTDGFCQNKGDGNNDPPIDSPDCPAVHVTATPTTPTVELLIDQSGTMTATYGNTNRWDAIRKALIDPTTGVVATLANKVVFGATLYSNKSHDVNGTQVGNAPCPTLTSRPRALNNFTAIQQLLQGANPDEDTPTPESIDAIRASFAANPPAQGSPPIIVLATDGLPDTCADADPPNQARQDAANAASVLAAQKAYMAGIKLFFLFVGDDAAGTHPQRMANAGAGLDPVTGTAPFYVATNPAQLTTAFNTIIGGVLSCDLKLNGHVDASDAPNGTVIVNGTTLTYGTDWTLDADSVTIHLLGTACNMLKNVAASTVDATFPCGTVIF